MSEKTPQLSPEATRDVDNAFDPEHRKAQAEWDSYLDSRPRESKKGNIKDPESGKKIDSDEYFDKKREDHADKSSKAYENMTPFELTRKIAEAKFQGDKTTEQNLYDALLDNIEKQQKESEGDDPTKSIDPSRDLFAEYDHRIDEAFQRLHENEQAKNPESKDDEAAIAAAAILDPKNIAELRKDIEDGEGQGEDETPGTGEPEIPEGSGNTPGTELVPYPTPEPLPDDEAERSGWFRRNKKYILGAVAAGALLIGAGASLLTLGGNKDNKRSGSDEKTEQPAKKGGQAKSNEFKTNDSFSHPDRKTGPGFELGDTAPEAIDQLKQNFKHHPVLLAEAVYAYQNGISVDKARANEDNINKMAKSFIVDGHLTAEGQAWATKLGKSLDNGSAHWVTQDEMHHSTWFNSGIEENGAFDKFDINDKAGFNAKKILRITLGNGKVIYLKYDCQNMLWYEDTESQGSSTTTERGSSTVTLDGKVKFNPRGWDNPKNPTKKHTPKGEVKVDHEGTADTGGVRSKGPEEKPHQDANNQTSDQANEKTGGGSQGSTKPAEGADQGPKPTGGTEQNASGENNSGTVGE